MPVTDILKAMATSAAILFPIVVLVVIVSIAVVRRGEIATGAGTHSQAHAGVMVETAGAVAAPAPAKKPAEAAQMPGVLEILGLGTAIFVVAVLILLGISILAHM